MPLTCYCDVTCSWQGRREVPGVDGRGSAPARNPRSRVPLLAHRHHRIFLLLVPSGPAPLSPLAEGTLLTSLGPPQRFTPKVNGGHDHPAWHLGKKPLGFSSFSKELFPVPEAWAASTGNLVFYRYHEKVRHAPAHLARTLSPDLLVSQGGHFAASERPEALLKDLEDFVLQVSAKPVP